MEHKIVWEDCKPVANKEETAWAHIIATDDKSCQNPQINRILILGSR